MSNHAEDTQLVPDPGDAGGHSARTKWTAICVLVMSMLVLVFGAYAMLGPSPRVPLGVLTAIWEGESYVQDGPVSSKPRVAAQATTIASQHSVAAGRSSSSSGGDRFFQSTLAIFNRDDDLLMQRVGLMLFERLQDEDRFDEIRYVPAGEQLPAAKRLPDIFVTLEKQDWQESGLPGRREFTGELSVTACDRLCRSNHSYHETGDPPQVKFDGHATIDYSATQTGIETSGARYQTVSRDLAKVINAELTKLMDELSKQYDSAAELPEAFYPAYDPPPDFDFVTSLDAAKVVDGPALMRPTVTVWQTPADDTPKHVLTTIRQALADTEWKVSEEPESLEHLRATKDAQVLEAFRENAGHDLHEWTPETPSRCFIVYTHSMPPEDARAAVEKLFAERTDEATLLMFQNQWHRHRDAVEAYFRDRPPTTAATWLKLAQLHKKRDPDAARRALLQAKTLSEVHDDGTSDSGLKKLAKELDVTLPDTISSESVRQLGLPHLLESGELTIAAHTNEPAIVWLGELEDEQSFLHLTPRRRQQLEIKEIETDGRSRSWTSRTIPLRYDDAERRDIVVRRPHDVRVEIFSQFDEDNQPQLVLRRQ